MELGNDSCCTLIIFDLVSDFNVLLWQDGKFGYCRFSRDGKQAFLFVSITKGKF
jgi:prolactin regulatory element-binding protein